jgi:predicted DsbA family dithiol-disulfide isomerase
MSTIFTLRPAARRETIVLYHDYLCPWCWVGLFQAQKLTKEFGVNFEWVGAELFPPELSPERASTPGVKTVDTSKKTRFDLFCDAEGIAMGNQRPGFVRTHNALLAAEWAKTQETQVAGAFDAFNEAVYRAFWERFENIEDITVLKEIADSVGLNGAEMENAIISGEFESDILHFDDDAYNAGIRHVPTFVFGAEEQLAEAHYPDLARATERFLLRKPKS